MEIVNKNKMYFANEASRQRYILKHNLKGEQIPKQLETLQPNSSITFIDITTVDKPQKYLQEIKKLLDKNGVKWFVAFGTALGFYRDKDIIKGDSDFDIVVLADGRDLSFIDDFPYRVIRTVNSDKPYQKCFQSEDNVIIDICFFYREGDEYYTKTPQGQFRDKVSVIGDLQAIRTKYGTFPFPEKMPEYLTTRYGDWKTPKYGALSSSIKQ